jgi:hypothetical protein
LRLFPGWLAGSCQTEPHFIWSDSSRLNAEELIPNDVVASEARLISSGKRRWSHR